MNSLNILSSSSLLCMLPDSSLKCFDETVYVLSSSYGSSASTLIVSADPTDTTLPTQPSHVIEYGWPRLHVAITISPIRNIPHHPSNSSRNRTPFSKLYWMFHLYPSPLTRWIKFWVAKPQIMRTVWQTPSVTPQAVVGVSADASS